MLSALLYLQYHSFRNRLISRFKRLKQPKYLVGAIVGGIYFYFYFVRYMFLGSNRRGAWSAMGGSLGNLPLYESLGALALFVIVLMAWLVPHERAALTFSEPEVAFLFPAPVSRRGLIQFKLMRSQLRIFFTVLILTLVTSRGGSAWIHAAGYWLILSTLNFHFLGSSFARTLLLDRGISNAFRRIVVLVMAAMIVGIVVVWARRTMPEFQWQSLSNGKELSDYIQRVLTSGPALYLLFPFRLLARPYLAPNATAFLAALGPALILLILHYVWVVSSNVAFEEASVEASQKLAARVSAAKAGNWLGSTKQRKAKRAIFKLAPTGPPSVALLWKNLISAGHALTWRMWLIVVFLGVILYAGTAGSLHGTEVFSILMVSIGACLGWSLLLGPQFLRQDLRQDLLVADILKTYPLRGWQIVLGEIMAPVVILCVAQWLLVMFGIVYLVRARGLSDGPLPFTLAFAVLLVLPALDMILLMIPNAAVLLFPSWVQAGKDSPRGIEATGQRLIMTLGQFLAFAIALVPAAIVFVIVFFIVRFAAGLALAVPLASIAAVLILATEVGLGLMLLGRWFERFDVSSEMNP